MPNLTNLVNAAVYQPQEGKKMVDVIQACETLATFHPGAADRVILKFYETIDAEFASDFDEYGSYVVRKPAPDPNPINLGTSTSHQPSIEVPMDWFVKYIVEPTFKSNELIPMMFLKELKTHL